ncbi:MAG: hypothetical protein ACRDLS_07040 [Solirubrobacteraceae bacterium]
MRRTSILLFTAVAVSLALAAPASAGLADKLVRDFSDDGALNACNYSAREIATIKSLIGEDIDAYQPDLRSAIDAMLEEHAQGKCNTNKREPGGDSTSSGTAGTAGGGSDGPGTAGTPSTGKAATPATPGAAKPAPAPGAVQTAAPLISGDAIQASARTAQEGETPPFPLLALAALMALMALGTIVWGVLRFTGWEPAWAPRARHAAAEAGWRASSTWAEFTDFVRFGR